MPERYKVGDVILLKAEYRGGLMVVTAVRDDGKVFSASYTCTDGDKPFRVSHDQILRAVGAVTAGDALLSGRVEAAKADPSKAAEAERFCKMRARHNSTGTPQNLAWLYLAGCKPGDKLTLRRADQTTQTAVYIGPMYKGKTYDFVAELPGRGGFKFKIGQLVHPAMEVK